MKIHTLTLSKDHLAEICNRCTFSKSWNYQKYDVRDEDQVTLCLEADLPRPGRLWAKAANQQIEVYFDKLPHTSYSIEVLLTPEEYETACEMARRECKPRHLNGNHWRKPNGGSEYVQSMIQHLCRAWKRAMEKDEALPVYNSK